MPVAFRTYGRPLAEVPIFYALALVVEEADQRAHDWTLVMGQASMWADKDTQVDVNAPMRQTWRKLHQKRPAVAPTAETAGGDGLAAPDWWLADADDDRTFAFGDG